MQPRYTVEQIKFASNPDTFSRAVEIYENGGVENFQEQISCYTAKVKGKNSYSVGIENRNFRLGNCDCYMGKNNYLCKHLIALGIYAVLRGKPLDQKLKQDTSVLEFTNHLGQFSPQELKDVKKSITHALSYLKGYTGPSKIWFAYQDKLSEGVHRLTQIVSTFPVSKQTSDILVDLLLRLGNKLATTIDDSDGTVGGFADKLVGLLLEYAKLDSACKESFKVFKTKETGFGFEGPLKEMLVYN